MSLRLAIVFSCVAAAAARAQPKDTAPALSAGGWQRASYAPAGGDAQLFYVVFGSWEAQFPISRSQYRTAGMPAGMTAAMFPIGHEQCQVPLYADMLQYAGGAEVAPAAKGAARCMVIRGNVTDPKTLEYLRDLIGIVTAGLDAGGVGVFDVIGARWWLPAEWRKSVFDAPFDARNHVMILVTEETDGKGRWVHTRGLRKFGRPDFAAHHVAGADAAAYLEAITKMAAAEAAGTIYKNGPLPVTVKNLPRGLSMSLTGSDDDRDFNNVHFEIVPGPRAR